MGTKRGWNKKRREKKGEERWSTASNTHAMAKGKASEWSDTQKNTSAQAPCRVPQPGCTKCTKTSLGFLAVRLSPREPKKCYGLNRYKHTRGLSTKSQKKGGIDSPSFNPLTIVADGDFKERKKKSTNKH
jgi:hypothetical protein